MAVDWTYGELGIPGDRDFAPDTDLDSDEYWSGLRDGRLTAQRCTACGTFRFPPGPRCHACGSPDAEWTGLSETGTLYSWIVVTRPTHAALSEPYSVALVDLPEGVRVMGILVVPEGVPSLAAGDPIAVHVDVRLDYPRIVFEPAGAAARPADTVAADAVAAAGGGR